MDNVFERARRVGLNPAGMTERALMDELERRETEEYAFFSRVRTCKECGRDSVPMVYGDAEESIEVCPVCRSVESFSGEELSR